MMHRLQRAALNMIGALMASASSLVATMLLVAAPAVCLAQAPVTLHQNVTLYRAFYYDASDNLLHIEIVRNAGGRFLQPLLSAPKVTPQAPPPEQGSAVLVGDKARYAVYYGLDSSQVRPTAGQRNVQSKALATENLSEADASRAIECASQGGDVCLFPKMCHCGAFGGCCCY